METRLTITTTSVALPNGNEAAILELYGELDLGQPAVALHENVDKLLAGGIDYIILNFAGIKSCQPDWLVLLGERLRKSGGEMPLVMVPDKIMSILQFLEIDKHFQIYPTITEAINAAGETFS